MTVCFVHLTITCEFIAAVECFVCLKTSVTTCGEVFETFLKSDLYFDILTYCCYAFALNRSTKTLAVKTNSKISYCIFNNMLKSTNKYVDEIR